MEHRLEALEKKVRFLEDRLAIYQLVATYGPAVDGLNGESLGRMWTEDGTYSPGGFDPYVGNAAVAELINTSAHRSYAERGCAHVMSMPHVVVDGDTAVATNVSRVYVKDGDQWRVDRASANRWELVRNEERWQVRNRTNRLLDGSEEPRQLLRAHLSATD
jgi:hypothetical protein